MKYNIFLYEIVCLNDSVNDVSGRTVYICKILAISVVCIFLPVYHNYNVIFTMKN